MNKVLVIGMCWACNEPIKLYNIGASVCSQFTIGVESYKIVAGGQKKWYWTYNKVRAFGWNARLLADKLKHGDTISLEGMMVTDMWKLKSGIIKTQSYIKVETVHWIWKKETENYMKLTKDETVKVFGRKAPPPSAPHEVEVEDDFQSNYYDVLPDWKGL